VICVDNSEYMRNGDYTPSRLEAQHDAVNLICGAKIQSNPESTVAVIACAGRSPEVLVSLTTDLGKVLSSLHSMKITGGLNFSSGIQVSQLALKHRQNKNQHQRIVVFIGSPINNTTEELVRLGKRLKKNNIAVDVVNFGEETSNTEKLEALIAAVNNSDNSHLITIPPGPHILSDILVTSPIITGDGGGMPTTSGGGAGSSTGDFNYGVDPNMDPELALALKVSMEEERARQEAEAKKKSDSNAPIPATTAPVPQATPDVEMAEVDEEAELAKAIALSMQPEPLLTPKAEPKTSTPVTKPSEDTQMQELSEEQEVELALQMSLAADAAKKNSAPSQPASSTPSNHMADPDFVNSVLLSLPGVDPNDERIKSVLASLTKPADKKDDKDDKKDKK